jgi:hypothetical protein
MTDCVCWHYKQNHKFIKGQGYIGKCKGQIGCAGHEPCSCKKFRVERK